MFVDDNFLTALEYGLAPTVSLFFSLFLETLFAYIGDGIVIKLGVTRNLYILVFFDWKLRLNEFKI